MTGPVFQQLRQHSVQHVKRAQVVDLLVHEHLRQVKAIRPLSFVMARAVHHQIQATGLLNLVRSGADSCRVCDVQGQCNSAGVRLDKTR